MSSSKETHFVRQILYRGLVNDMAILMTLVAMARGILFQENENTVTPGFRMDRMVP